MHQFFPERLVAVHEFQLAEGRQDQIFFHLLDLTEGCNSFADRVIAHDGDADRDEKWTEIIGGMTIYKDAELKTYLEQAGFHDVQIHKKKSWLCITAWK